MSSIISFPFLRCFFQPVICNVFILFAESGAWELETASRGKKKSERDHRAFFDQHIIQMGGSVTASQTADVCPSLCNPLPNCIKIVPCWTCQGFYVPRLILYWPIILTFNKPHKWLAAISCFLSWCESKLKYQLNYLAELLFVLLLHSDIPEHSEMFWDAASVVSILITYYQGFEPAESLEKGIVGRMSQIPAK